MTELDLASKKVMNKPYHKLDAIDKAVLEILTPQIKAKWEATRQKRAEQLRMDEESVLSDIAEARAERIRSRWRFGRKDVVFERCKKIAVDTCNGKAKETKDFIERVYN